MLVAVVFGGIQGCGVVSAVGGAIGATRTSVTLVNTSDEFTVEVELYYHDDQDAVDESILREFGRERNFTITPNDAPATFSVDCDDLQAIYIERATLVISGIETFNQDTDIFRDGTDFRCGDLLVFEFEHGDLGTNFNIRFRAE
jgi:hypothetical protein